MRYAIPEIDTGYMDGWYSYKNLAVGVKDFWNEIRPEHKHFIIAEVDFFAIGDNIFLPHMIAINQRRILLCDRGLGE